MLAGGSPVEGFAFDTEEPKGILGARAARELAVVGEKFDERTPARITPELAVMLELLLYFRRPIFRHKEIVMIRHGVWVILVLIGAGAGLLVKTALTAKPVSIDYQKVADTSGWGWKTEMANPLGCISQCGDKYDIRMLSKKDDRRALTISIFDGGKQVFAWEGHSHSVFRILGDRLYYAEFNPSASGGNVVAVDLKTGKKLWTSPLEGLGSIQHSKYQNLMNLDANDDVVTIWGNESMGRYVEFKSAATGNTLANIVFPESTTQP